MVKFHFYNVQGCDVKTMMEKLCEIVFYIMQSCDVEIWMERVCEIVF